MRKYIKNVISVFLVIVMLMSQVQIPAATKNSGIRKVTFSMYSNYIGKRDRLKEFTETINFIFLLII